MTSDTLVKGQWDSSQVMTRGLSLGDKRRQNQLDLERMQVAKASYLCLKQLGHGQLILWMADRPM